MNRSGRRVRATGTGVLHRDGKPSGPAAHSQRRRLLCLSTYPEEDATVRERFLAYRPSLERAGWEVRFETILSSRLFRIKNRHGPVMTLRKTTLLAAGLMRRMVVLASCRSYDAIWIQREAFPFFAPRVERFLAKVSRARILFDFDDALYAAPPSGRDWRTRFRSPRGFEASLACADAVMAGSPALVAWAGVRGIHATFVPTCVNTSRYGARATGQRGVTTIGWVGSWSTAGYLDEVVDVLRRVAVRPSVRVLLVGAGNLEPIAAGIPGAEWRVWDQDRELADLSEFDIGIMPVPDSEWNRGKCAFKLIQYMALGVPYVASPVGMNVNVTEASGGGLMATGDEEWEAALSRLLADPQLGESLGLAGRAYAVAHFDHSVHAPVILRLLDGDSGSLGIARTT